MKCYNCETESKTVRLRKQWNGFDYNIFPACNNCAPKDDKPLPNVLVDHILNYTKNCSKCKIVGEERPFKYILGWCVLWRCTRCFKLYCYNCYEPDDGHMCFSNYEWPVGKGDYTDATEDELNCVEEIFMESFGNIKMA